MLIKHSLFLFFLLCMYIYIYINKSYISVLSLLAAYSSHEWISMYYLYYMYVLLFTRSDRIYLPYLRLILQTHKSTFYNSYLAKFVHLCVVVFSPVSKMTACSNFMMKCKCLFLLVFLIIILTGMYSLWRTVHAPLVGGCESITGGEVLVHVICLWALAFNCLKLSKHLGLVEPFFSSFLLCSLIRPAIHFHVVRSP